MEVNVSTVAAGCVNELSHAAGHLALGTYPSMLINFKSPPKYLAYNLEMGNPYPKPAIGALKSLLLKSGSSVGVRSTVVYM